MNVLKHMELIFGALLAIGCIIAAVPDELGGPVRREAANGAAMQVVVITAKRMTALEKRQSLELDAGTGSAAAGT
jgi:hypothetical protein